MSAVKSIKSAAKEAKMRLKTRFWEDYKKDLEAGVKLAEEEGLAPPAVKSYFKNRVVKSVMGTSEEDEKFYSVVKEMLDEAGEKPCDALDRLMDKRLFYALSYENRERYLFRLSDKYLTALERYDRERGIEQCLGK